MRHLTVVLSVLFGIILFSLSCTKSSSIGSDLVDQDQAKVVFSDTFSLQAKTINIDSVKTYGPLDPEQLNSYLCGRYVDPIFGRVEASIFTQLNLDESTTPAFVGNSIQLDSVVLSLAYDNTKAYGDVDAQLQHFEVYRMQEQMDRADIYYSNQTFAFDPDPIGSKSFLPRVADSLTIVDYTLSRPDTIRVVAHLRIPLEESFGRFLTSLDLSDYSNSTNFREKLPGIHIRAVEDTKAMLGFVMFSEESRITLYYTQDGIQKQYRYPFLFQSAKMNHYVNDYSGKEVVEFFDDPIKGDSLTFIQGMGGMNTVVEIPYANSLDNVIINNAMLEYFIAEDSESKFEPIDRILLANEFEDGLFVSIQDIIIASQLAQLDLYGGEPIMDKQLFVKKYRMNITAHFQDMVDGINVNPLISFPQFNREIADRVVLYGPGHAEFPMRLSVTYTKLN